MIVVRHAVATVSAFQPLTATTSKARRRAGEAGQAWRSTTTETRSRALEKLARWLLFALSRRDMSYSKGGSGGAAASRLRNTRTSAQSRGDAARCTLS